MGRDRYPRTSFIPNEQRPRTLQIHSAEASGNPTVFAMGMLNAGILSRVVTRFAGRPNVRGFKVRFATRVWPGDDVVCGGTVTRKFEEKGEKRVEGELSAVNQKGETLISGSFVVTLPSRR